ncbi:hypothetical protein Tco_0955289 [Tanacetum coccineum]|uniref:Uncharacterized protein n=1 Tax=Tanacetum coccineum TaxID=301880 RepID=A0ABQ5E6S3_9ASTR
MAHIQEVTPDPVDNSGPIFDDEPMHKVQNNNDNYNVFAMENEYLEQPESSNHIYLAEQGYTNITIDSLDICYDRDQDDQDDTANLDQEQEMVADLKYVNSLEDEVDNLKSQMETQKTQFLNEIDRLSREYYYADHMNAILGIYTDLDEFTDLQCDSEKPLEKYERVIPTTSVSRPQLKSNQLEDRVMYNNSQGKKQEVEDHRQRHLCLLVSWGRKKESLFILGLPQAQQDGITTSTQGLMWSNASRSINGKKYVLVFVDDFSRDNWTYSCGPRRNTWSSQLISSLLSKEDFMAQ